jgi:hypothetical protein
MALTWHEASYLICPDMPKVLRAPVPCIASNRTDRSCMHYFVHCLVGCTPYISITEILWQQLGYVMKVLAAKVVRQLEGKRLDLFELRFVECKKHSLLLPPFVSVSVITE